MNTTKRPFWSGFSPVCILQLGTIGFAYYFLEEIGVNSNPEDDCDPNGAPRWFWE